MADERGRPPEDHAGPPADVVRPLAPTPAEAHELTAVELADPIDDLPRGCTLGRYVILGRVAASASGVVYAAFDPDLDRKVALKLVPIDTPSDPQPVAEQQAQLIAAVQVAAKLSHPAIVKVLDVGAVPSGVFVVMEFVDGLDLRRWMDARDEPFPWPKVLDIFREAGRGLAAAHAAGVVHGDFKPDNVLIGKGDRIAVFDFGLALPPDDRDEIATAPAQVRDHIATARAADDVASPADAEELGELAAPGTVLGTPAYFAPELHIGAPADAKTDQFAFCVALYEALYGERPFAGTRRNTLAVQALNNRIRPAPDAANVPTWLREVLLRGLAPKRTDRHPSMDALLRALDHDPAARRRRWTKGLAAVLVVGGGLVGAAWWAQTDYRRCEADPAVVESVWNPDQRELLRSAFASTERPYAESAWQATESIVDEWVGQWLEYRVRACKATRVWGDGSDALLEQRNACLDERLGELAAFVRGYTAATPTMVDRAHEAASAIPMPRSCATAGALAATARPSEDIAERVAELRVEHDDAWAAYRAGAIAYARARIEPVAARLAELGYAPLGVTTHTLLGLIDLEEGHDRAAHARLHAAATEALRAELERPLAEIWLGLSRVDATLDPQAAPIWLDYAQSVLEGSKDELALAQVAEARGTLAQAGGRAGQALAEFHRALEILGGHTNQGFRRARVLVRLGALAAEQGELESAVGYLDRAVTAHQDALGPVHPALVDALVLRGTITARLDAHDQAATDFERAGGIMASDPDLDPAALAELDVRRAEIELERADYTAAETLLSAAMAALPPTAVKHRVDALYAIGRLRIAQGEFATAKMALASAISTAPLASAESPRRAEIEEAFALAMWPIAEDRRAALAHARRALDLYDRLGPDYEPQRARTEAWLREHSR